MGALRSYMYDERAQYADCGERDEPIRSRRIDKDAYTCSWASLRGTRPISLFPHIEPIEHELATFLSSPVDIDIDICTAACDRGVKKSPKT